MTCMEDADYALALRLQEEENQLADIPSSSSGHSAGGGPAPNSQKWPTDSRRRSSPPRPVPPPSSSLVDETYELIDPTPDIYQLFRDFDKHFFWGKLGSVELKWSPRMTRCAGVCSYQPASGLCSVRLSRPLLTLRPRSDLVETLLHEMIHALLFVTRNSDNREDHGPEFHRHMHRINNIAGTKISVYHTFHEEVRHMLTHWWRCTGSCRQRAPHFGIVKRSMNRAPGKNDFWWPSHQASCGGTFEKIKEPEGYGKKKGKKGMVSGSSNKLQDIRNFVGNGKAVPFVKKAPPSRPNGATKPVRGPTTAGGGRPQGHSGRPGGTPSPSPASGNYRPPTAKRPTAKRPTAEPPTAKSPTAKRPTAKRPTAKRPTAKSPTPKRPTAKPPTAKLPTAKSPSNRPGKRPASGSGGPAPQKRPPGNPTGVRPNIGRVSNGGGGRVNNISNNVHGFQRTTGRPGGATAMAGGGSRTVTVPPRRGGGGGSGSGSGSGGGGRGRGGGGGGGADATLGGRGHVLGGARTVPWYKRDPPPTAPRPDPPAVPSDPMAPASSAAPALSAAATSRRPPTGIFSSPETSKKRIPTASKTAEDSDAVEPTPDTVTCPVCGEKVSLQGINDHVDRCLVTESARGKRETKISQPGPSSESVWDDDDSDELLMSQAADKLETSLQASGWEEDAGDDQMFADAADALETSLEEHRATEDGALCDRGDTYNGESGDGGAAPWSPASEASTVIYDEVLGGKGEATARSPASETSTVYDELLDGRRGAAAAARSPESDVSTVYDEILDGPIVIDSSSDEEDYASQRADLSDVIKEFIKVEESDDDLLDGE